MSFLRSAHRYLDFRKEGLFRFDRRSGFRSSPSSCCIDVVDTTGAGDAFVGGFASGMVQLDGDLKEAAQYATVVAGLSVTKLSTAPAMPKTIEIMAVLDSNPFD